MAPNSCDDEPARWRMVEATNGYDVDNSWYRELRPVPENLPSRSRTARLAQALARRLSAFGGAQRQSAAHRRTGWSVDQNGRSDDGCPSPGAAAP